MPYVYSTLSNDHEYAIYPPDIDPRQITHPVRTIRISGGANVANKTSLLAPKGVVTHVSKEDLEVLENLKTFQRHQARGFIKVDVKKHDVRTVSKDMTPRDKSAQLTDKDFDEDKQPKLNDAKG